MSTTKAFCLVCSFPGPLETVGGFLFGFVLLFNFCQMCREQTPHCIDVSPGVLGMCLPGQLFLFLFYLTLFHVLCFPHSRSHQMGLKSQPFKKSAGSESL